MSRSAKENQDIPITASIVIFIISFLCILAVIWFVFTVFIPKGSWLNIVDGSSMEPTLQDGQIVFTDMTDLAHGDIITAYLPISAVERYPEKEGMLLIKRLIGLPGDTVRITAEGIYVNEQLLKEEYLPEENRQYTYIQGRQHEFALAEDEYFIVGDNRQVSYDSRSFGPVKDTDLIYKQSEKLTLNFAIKVGIVLITIILDIVLYMAIDNALTRCFLRIRKRK